MVKFKQNDFLGAIKNSFEGLAGILFYGPDRGQILENFNTVINTIAPNPDDGFSVFEFESDNVKADPTKLFDEALSISFLGTKKVIKIKDATNDVADVIADLLNKNENIEAVLVVAAGELTPSSKLRQFFENNKRLAVLPNYNDEGESLGLIISKTLTANGIKKIPYDVIEYLKSRLGENRATTRMELEKIALYLYGKESITIDDVEGLIIDSSVLNMSDLPMLVAEGNTKRLTSVLDRLIAEGANPVQLVRIVLNHFKSLYYLASGVEGGETIASVIDTARPPIFFKQRPSYEKQLRFWNTAKILKIISKINEVEIMCKTTNYPAETILTQILFNICSFAGKRG